MRIQPLPNKYNPGDEVFAKVNPGLKLVIRNYIKRIYYCTIQEDPQHEELVYFERELVENDELALQNEKKRMLMNKS
jgi:hypothetical protein